MTRNLAVITLFVLSLVAVRTALAGQEVVITSNRTGNAELFLVDLDGTDEGKNLTNDKSEDRYPDWSPDGTKIAFVSNRDGFHNIYVMDPDGKNVVQLTKGKEYSYAPAWSPDGKRIAYLERTQKGAFTRLMDPDGGNNKVLAENVWDPAWSPDGNKIAFTRFTNKGFKIHVMDADGKNQVDLDTGDNVMGFSYPAWSRDGKKLVYADLTTANSLELISADADGQNQEILTNLGGINSFSAFSPDGKRIMFRSVTRGAQYWPFHLVDPDGKNHQPIEKLAKEPPLVNQLDPGRPAWRPAKKESE